MLCQPNGPRPATFFHSRGSPPSSSYLFRHTLVQDAAYQSLLRSRRRELHRKIAEALEKRLGEGRDSPPELLAHHFDEAGLAEPAVAYYRSAGERAEERFASTTRGPLMADYGEAERLRAKGKNGPMMAEKTALRRKSFRMAPGVYEP